MNGWFDCRLRVDLSSGNILRESIVEQVLRAFIGGRGLNDCVTSIIFDRFGSAAHGAW